MDARIAREYATSVFPDWQRVVDTLERWSQNYSTRRELGQLDAHQLSDIGVDKITAQLECEKPFWRD